MNFLVLLLRSVDYLRRLSFKYVRPTIRPLLITPVMAPTRRLRRRLFSKVSRGGHRITLLSAGTGTEWLGNRQLTSTSCTAC